MTTQLRSDLAELIPVIYLSTRLILLQTNHAGNNRRSIDFNEAGSLCEQAQADYMPEMEK